MISRTDPIDAPETRKENENRLILQTLAPGDLLQLEHTKMEWTKSNLWDYHKLIHVDPISFGVFVFVS